MGVSWPWAELGLARLDLPPVTSPAPTHTNRREHIDKRSARPLTRRTPSLMSCAMVGFLEIRTQADSVYSVSETIALQSFWWIIRADVRVRRVGRSSRIRRAIRAPTAFRKSAGEKEGVMFSRSSCVPTKPA